MPPEVAYKLIKDDLMVSFQYIKGSVKNIGSHANVYNVFVARWKSIFKFGFFCHYLHGKGGRKIDEGKFIKEFHRLRGISRLC